MNGKENFAYVHNGIDSAFKKMLSFVIAWVNLKNIMLSEVTRHRKATLSDLAMLSQVSDIEGRE